MEWPKEISKFFQSAETCFNQPRFSSNQNIIIRCILQECGNFTWRVSDCEELVGVSHRG